MEILFLCVVIFLFLLAVFDLSVGVSNDAVNFLNSAIGSKAAAILISATTNVAPKSSNTIDTVVEVGIPSELKMSRNLRHRDCLLSFNQGGKGSVVYDT